MNKEEKNAICELKNYISRRKLKYTKLDRHDKAIDNLLNLIEKVQKENKELKEENELNKIIKYTKLDKLFCTRNGKEVKQAIKLRDELLKLLECKLYGIKKCKKNVILITKEEVIPVQKVKDKIEELIKEGRHYNANKIEVLQELLESEE